VTPSPFRKSGFSHTTRTTRAEAIATYGTIIKLVISSTPSLSDDFLATNPHTPSHECLASPFCKLLLLFEALIFQPESSLTALSHNVIRRLKLLANGHVEELHAKMMARPQSKPTTRTCQANIDEWNELCFLPIDDSTFSQPNTSPRTPLIVITFVLPSKRLTTPSPLPLTLTPSSQPCRKSCTHPVSKTTHTLSPPHDSLPPCHVDASSQRTRISSAPCAKYELAPPQALTLIPLT
jgi:hypothetical protein